MYYSRIDQIDLPLVSDKMLQKAFKIVIGNALVLQKWKMLGRELSKC